MFQRFGEIFQRHPWWIVGGVIGVVILIWLMMRGGSSGQMAVYSSGPTDAQVQGAYALQAAQITANATTAQAQLANEKSANDNAAAITLNAMNTRTAAMINEQNTNAATAINSSNNTAAVQINQQNVVGATTINAQNTGAATAINAQNADAAVKIAAGQQAIDMVKASSDANNSWVLTQAQSYAIETDANTNQLAAFYEGRNKTVATDALYNAVNNRYGVGYVQALTGNK